MTQERIVAELAEARKQVAALREALDLVPPLAKGYAAQNNVGSNRRYIEVAEAALAAAQPALTSAEQAMFDHALATREAWKGILPGGEG